MKDRRDHHWGPALTIALTMLLLELIPRYTFAPSWLAIIQVLLLVAALAAPFGKFDRSVRNVTLASSIVGLNVINGFSLAKIINLVVLHGKQAEGARLLSTSAAIWIVNVLAFGLTYWLLDGGGPEERLARPFPRDFTFPIAPQGEAAPPNFFDYIFLSFSTATAFSPTDTPPLTTRARVLILVESVVSLLTIVVTAARAVNILE